MTPVTLALAGCLLALRMSGLAAQLDDEVEGSAAQPEEIEEDLNETVICTNDQIKVIIPSTFFLNKVPPVYVWDLHLNDPECRGVEMGDNYVFSIETNLTDCGTHTVSDGMNMMFINTIHNNNSDVITRSYVNITFGCRYPVNYMVQQPNGDNMIRVDVRTIILNTEDGNFSVAMQLYKDRVFEDKWTTVPSLGLDDDIYVKVFMIPAHLTLRLERCWATPTSDPHSNIQYSFIQESCPVPGSEPTLEVLRNGQGPEAMFRIQMFKFVGSSYTDVFLHCVVQICPSSEGVCQPNCSGEEASSRTRRDVTMSHTVSYGPIRRLLDNREISNLNNPTVISVESVVLGSLLLVLLLITGVFVRLWHRSRRSYPPNDAQLTLSNIHHLSEVAS